jgi:GAF domain-containing protein
MGDGEEANEMLPVSQTTEALNWLAGFGSRGIEKSLREISDRVRAIAPRCVALSLSVLNGEATFTLMADRGGAALLDAMQYLDGGPCIDAVLDDEVKAKSDLPTDEGRWQMLAQAEAYLGISSSLSFPLREDGRVVGGVNLYGSTSDAFDGHHDELAAACGALAREAITNGDLGFTSRIRAAVTPDRLHERGHLDTASGLVAARQNISLEEAIARIRAAAKRAGVADSEFARFILDSHGSDLELGSPAHTPTEES